MSHANTNVIYPQSTARTASWQVREDGDDYDKGNNVQTVSLLDLHVRIIDRLDRAKAMACLLQTADTKMDDTISMTAAMLEELIEQAQSDSRRMLKYIQREKKHGSSR